MQLSRYDTDTKGVARDMEGVRKGEVGFNLAVKIVVGIALAPAVEPNCKPRVSCYTCFCLLLAGKHINYSGERAHTVYCMYTLARNTPVILYLDTSM